MSQISFSGKYAPDTQSVLYITEKAVFKLVDHVLTLIEVAPGLDAEKDVIAKMGFRPAVSPDLKEMPPEIFQEKWGGLGKTMLAEK